MQPALPETAYYQASTAAPSLCFLFLTPSFYELDWPLTPSEPEWNCVVALCKNFPRSSDCGKSGHTVLKVLSEGLRTARLMVAEGGKGVASRQKALKRMSFSFNGTIKEVFPSSGVQNEPMWKINTVSGRKIASKSSHNYLNTLPESNQRTWAG